MNKLIMHVYSALLCIVVHPKHFTIMWGGGSLLNHNHYDYIMIAIYFLFNDNILTINTIIYSCQLYIYICFLKKS